MTDRKSGEAFSMPSPANLLATQGRKSLGVSARLCHCPAHTFRALKLLLIFCATSHGLLSRVAQAEEPQRRARAKRAVVKIAPADKPAEKDAEEKPATDKPAADKPPAEKVPTEKPANPQDAKKAAETAKVANRKIQRKLQARTDLNVDKLPLKEVVKQIAELHEIPIRLDEAALKKAGVAPDRPITAAIKNFTLALALNHILKELNLHYGVVNGEIVIGDPPPPEPEERPAAAPVAAEAVIMDAMPAAVMQLGGPGGEALAQQFTRQHKALLKAELHLVRAVCKPTDEQWQRLQEDLEQSLKGKLANFQALQKQVERQRRGAQVQVGDPLQLSRSWVQKSVTSHLTAEQAALYQQEIDSRAADRRNASIHNVVARLDHDLILSDSQRDKITTRLRANWNDGWCPSPNQFIQMEQWFPNIPDQHIVEFLEPEQKKIWNTNRNPNRGVVFAAPAFAGFMGGMFGEEFLWQDEEGEAEAKAPAANARPAE